MITIRPAGFQPVGGKELEYEPHLKRNLELGMSSISKLECSKTIGKHAVEKARDIWEGKEMK